VTTTVSFGPRRKSLFDETNWGLIKAAQAGDTSKARSALAELCETYWYPLYAFIRRKGYATDQAQDLTQGFFLVLLEHEFLKTIGREKGKFRSFLLASCRNYLVNEGDRQRARKRGQGRVVLNVDLTDAEARYAKEPAHTMTAERLFERRWTMTLLDRVLEQLRTEMTRSGKGPLFDRLAGAIRNGFLCECGKGTEHVRRSCQGGCPSAPPPAPRADS